MLMLSYDDVGETRFAPSSSADEKKTVFHNQQCIVFMIIFDTVIY